MKCRLLILMFISFSYNLVAQTPEWQWVRNAGGDSNDNGNTICTDLEGNVYVSGYFQESASFGPHNIISTGGQDIFVAKMDISGNWLWVEQASGEEFENSFGICTDNFGNVYITGYFEETVNFGTISLTSFGNNDIFIAKIDNMGNWIWAKNAGGSAADHGSDLCIDVDGNILLTGYFKESVFFGTINLISYGAFDIFVAKLDTNGNWIWAKKAGGIDTDSSGGICTDTYGNMYITGVFEDSASFGSLNLNSYGAFDIFVAKLDTNGNWIWVKKAGGINSDAGLGIDIDTDENVMLTGSFVSNSAQFGSIHLINSGGQDIFVAKIDAESNWLWAINAGGSGYDRGSDIVTDSECNMYVTGYFFDTSSFGSLPLISNGQYDVFVTKVDTDGNWLWAINAGGDDFDESYDLCIDTEGNIYVTGYCAGLANFGTFIINCSGGSDIFVAKLSTTVQVEDIIISEEVKFSNFPNPFNPSTTIEFSIPNNSNIDLSIYNLKGQIIKTLIKDELNGGSHSIIWTGEDESGKSVSSGLYFYKLNVNGKTKAVKKCLLLK